MFIIELFLFNQNLLLGVDCFLGMAAVMVMTGGWAGGVRSVGLTCYFVISQQQKPSTLHFVLRGHVVFKLLYLLNEVRNFMCVRLRT